MMLKDKIALIYGAGGDIGSAVARAFAREGAKLFLSGRNLGTVKAVAADIKGQGAVAEKTGAIDISFSAISVANALPDKVPLLELSAAHFALPIAAYTQSNFL